MTMPATIDPAALAAALQIVQAYASQQSTTKAVSATARSSGYAHGNGGLMSAPGMSRDIINAMLMPYAGLAARLPSLSSREDFPLYGIITGQTAGSTESGSAGVCDDPPTAGLLKLCEQSYPFGRRSLMTPVIEIDRVGRSTNRAEFYDFQLVGNPLANSENSAEVFTAPSSMTATDMLNNELGKAMFELGVDWIRRYGPELYTGNPTNNTAGGQHRYFRGLDGLINTGYRDAETAVVCPAADSIVWNFASNNVSTSNSGIVRLLTNIYRRLKLKARNMGLMPVKWVIVMRETLFYELTEVWPCSYATYRCQNIFSAAQPGMTETSRMIDMRDQMRGNFEGRTGTYLLIDGEQVEVVFDDLITETALSLGAFNSAIYFVPLTVIGGRKVTYMEHFDYGATMGSMDAARGWAPADSYFTTDSDAYLWHKRPPTAYCIQAQVKAEPRLILRAPHISARVTNVAYTPLQHEQDWNTTGYYFVNGGKTDRLGYGPSFFSETATIG